MSMGFRCIIHGSFSKHFDLIVRARRLFEAAGIEVLAPKSEQLIGGVGGFALFQDEIGLDPRHVELEYLHNMKKLGPHGFSYFVNPDGYIGKSASYELGIAQVTNTRCFFSHKLDDHPAYVHGGSVFAVDKLVDVIKKFGTLPLRSIRQSEGVIHKLWQDLMVPGSIVAAGAIIEHQPRTSVEEREILLVQTYKWGGRYSIVGGKVRRNERLYDALLREVKEETMLSGSVGKHICTFDQIKDSGYYQGGIEHIFVDNIVAVKSKKVSLNHEANGYIWVRPSEALATLDIEPNAKTTIEDYVAIRSQNFDKR